jgi:hypothetical protein
VEAAQQKLTVEDVESAQYKQTLKEVAQLMYMVLEEVEMA